MVASNDYYTVLGVSPLASPEEIKAAYRHLVKCYHPDITKKPETTPRFLEIQKAYQVLSDPVKRQEYDQQNHHRGQVSSRSGSRYVFLALQERLPVVFGLGKISYSLSAQEASLLLRQGLLRGSKAQSNSGSFYCHRCQHLWNQFSARSSELPSRCPACHAIDWSEFLLLRCLHCSAVFESEGSLREQMVEDRKGQLFTPYDLFPCCPACKQSRWCSAEEARLKALQEQKEARLKALREQALREQEELRRRQEYLESLRPPSTDFDIYEAPDHIPYIPYED